MPFSFDIEKIDSGSRARAGVITTNHGKVHTPAFCPVGTQATVKTLSAKEDVLQNTDIILNNAYHLYLRPGIDILKKMGGLHKFQSWDKAIVTDSGGFQIFSLSGLTKVNLEGARFQSPYDGSYHFISPERIVDIQSAMGSDIMMSLDECLPYPCNHADADKSLDLTLHWEKRGIDHWRELSKSVQTGALYGIVQGGFHKDLRKRCIEELAPMDFPGYALGGLSVGEPKGLLYEMVDLCTEYLPDAQPRHLLGVGKPLDILRCIELGIDHFDCVIPTRNARNGSVYTWKGKFSVKAGAYKSDDRPIDTECDCFTCRNFSRGYLRHLFNAGELLAPRLATIHSIHFYLDFMKKIRKAILDGQFSEFARDFRATFSDDTITPIK
ncbi:MAG: tRNA guanosine(34) transglycosylase Tgt [Candidatus Zixiibacteriota bacterium]